MATIFSEYLWFAPASLYLMQTANVTFDVLVHILLYFIFLILLSTYISRRTDVARFQQDSFSVKRDKNNVLNLLKHKQV
jgi:hypothetical protein